MTRVGQEQARKEARKAREAALNNPDIQKAKKPIAVVAGLAAIYSGEPMRVKVGDSAQLMARTDVRSSKGQLGFNSDYLNGLMEMDARNPDRFDSTDPRFADASQNNERYKLWVGRPLILDVTGGMTYGSSTQTVATSLSRPLTDNMICVVDSIRPVSGVGSSPATLSEERVKVQYGIHF
jgi:hypothetical protein